MRVDRLAAPGLPVQGAGGRRLTDRLHDPALRVWLHDDGGGGAHGEGHLFNGSFQQFRRADRLAAGLRHEQESLRPAPRSAFGFEEASVIDGHRGLAGDGLDQALVVAGERLLGGPDQDEGSEHLVPGAQRRGQDRLGAAAGDGLLVACILRRVRDQRRRAMLHHPSDHTLTDLEALDLGQGHGHPQRGLDLQLLTRGVAEKKRGGVEGDQRVQLLQHLAEGRVEVEGGAQGRAHLGQEPEGRSGRGRIAGQDPKTRGRPRRACLPRPARLGGHASESRVTVP